MLKNAAIYVIGLYKRYLSPIYPKSCRYYPSCSDYTIGAILKYGVITGIIKGFLRISRCNGFFHGGYDPIK